MDQAILDVVQGGVTVDSLILVVQLIIAAFIGLWIHGWITKTWAYHKYKTSDLVGRGTCITATANGTYAVVGRIKSANKGRVVVEDLEDSNKITAIPTKDFVSQAWTIHMHEPE